MYSFMGGGLFCAIVGNILLVVSCATDYWMQYRLSGSFAHQGLWRDHVLHLYSVCSAGHGHLHGGDGQLPGQALWGLALLLVLHPGMGGPAHDLLCRRVAGPR
ncbi:hypothetical protein JZ751_029725 [Albula glossodonta]|uniref:Uncharacterized protein n=1 Tax=Albula glossodonta TaxID=121402 RepID=A0A8T2NB19_9TELE|nr:hypothetical protein JZ751_029725 [Albula glossodonta]